MPNIHNIKSSYILKFLISNGFTIHNQRGSHIQLKGINFHGKITIPHHPNKVLNIKTIISILKQSGIDKELFLNPKK